MPLPKLATSLRAACLALFTFRARARRRAQSVAEPADHPAPRIHPRSGCRQTVLPSLPISPAPGPDHLRRARQHRPLFSRGRDATTLSWCWKARPAPPWCDAKRPCARHVVSKHEVGDLSQRAGLLFNGHHARSPGHQRRRKSTPRWRSASTNILPAARRPLINCPDPGRITGGVERTRKREEGPFMPRVPAGCSSCRKTCSAPIWRWRPACRSASIGHRLPSSSAALRRRDLGQSEPS